MTENGRAHFFAQPLFEHALHIRGADVFPVAVLGAFCHDDDMVTTTGPGPGFEPVEPGLADVYFSTMAGRHGRRREQLDPA